MYAQRPKKKNKTEITTGDFNRKIRTLFGLMKVQNRHHRLDERSYSLLCEIHISKLTEKPTVI